MPDVAIITASYGSYDHLKPPVHQEGIDAEWVLVTDNLEQYAEWQFLNSNPDFEYGNQQWRVIYDPRPDEIPMRAAKHAKLFPWEYTDARMSIWIDGSVLIKTKSFAKDVVAQIDPIGQFAHPTRDCIYDEASMSAKMVKYAGEPIIAQAEHYYNAGHPQHWGLWETTVIGRKHTSEIKALGWQWQKEMDTWSFQDQVSQPYVLRNIGLRPAFFSGPWSARGNNPWLDILMSEKHDASGYYHAKVKE